MKFEAVVTFLFDFEVCSKVSGDASAAPAAFVCPSLPKIPYEYIYFLTKAESFPSSQLLLISLSLSFSLSELTLSHSLSLPSTMSSSSKSEGEGVAPQNKGSWSTFLRVRNRPPRKEAPTESLMESLVDSIFQWRSLIHDCSSLHTRHHVPHRIFGILD